MSNLLRVLEAILLRAAPGLVNLGTLLLMGEWLLPADYGIYSTVLATTGLFANLVFGPLTFAVISQHAKLESAGMAQAYESSLVSAVLIIATAVTALGVAAATIGWIRWVWIAPMTTLGVYTAVQEILHARLRLWAFGTAALCQAIVFLVLSYVLVRTQPDPATALTAFAASYGVAIAVSLAFSGWPSLRWPDRELLQGTVAVGGPYTMGGIAEQGLYVGMRYLIHFVGTPQYLGAFSFCVDLSQRLIGFLTNAVSFALVPAAFKADAQGSNDKFHNTLRSGVALAIGLALTCLLAVLALRQTNMISALNGELFDPWGFALISAAIVINRVKKLVVDPVAMRAHRAIVIAIGYGVGAPVALGIGALAINTQGSRTAELTYLFGYALAAAVTVVATSRFVNKQYSS